MSKSMKVIMRYSFYYHGWCLSSGEHRIGYDENLINNWVECYNANGVFTST